MVVYDEVKVEPTDHSFLAAAKFACEGNFDDYISADGRAANCDSQSRPQDTRQQRGLEQRFE